MREDNSWLNAEMVLKKIDDLLVFIGGLVFLLLFVVKIVVVTFSVHNSLSELDILFCNLAFKVLLL